MQTLSFSVPEKPINDSNPAQGHLYYTTLFLCGQMDSIHRKKAVSLDADPPEGTKSAITAV